MIVPDRLHHLLLQFIMAEGAKSRLRRDEMRTVVAHIFRLTANNMPPGTLRQQPAVCSRMLEFISDTLRYLQTGTSGELQTELQECRFTQMGAAHKVEGLVGSHLGAAQVEHLAQQWLLLI